MFAKADIIHRLQKDILSLQGFRPSSKNEGVDAALGPIRNAFPHASFPLGAIHEFTCASMEDCAATSGFVSGILSPLMRKGGVTIWIGSSLMLFPPALITLGIDPHKIIFIDLKKEKDILWVLEESLKCKGLSAVVGELRDLDFTASRRLQLAVEKSQVTGFVLRRDERRLNTTAALTRWKISSLPGSLYEDGMPGLGFPRWNVELLKVRNGKPGSWQVEWIAGRFHHTKKASPVYMQVKRKTG